jgi:hypothetical protein
VSEPITHDELVARAVRWLSKRCVVVLSECSAYCSNIIPDAIGWTARGNSILIECKVSVGDFYADRHKPGAQAGHRIGAERFYMTPPGLLNPAVLTDWGLLEVHPKSIRKVKDSMHQADKAPLSESNRVRQEMIILLAEMRRIADGWRKNPNDKNYHAGQVGVQYAAELEQPK